MIRFAKAMRDSRIILEYTPEEFNPRWLWTNIQSRGRGVVSKVFKVERSDLITEPTDADFDDDIDDFVYRFQFATRSRGYYRIEGRRLGIPNPVLIAQDIALSRRLFAAHRDISIFRRIADLLDPEQEIVIGGEREDAIPYSEFDRLLSKFPGTIELNRYAAARVSDVLGQYFDGMKDARAHYEDYLSRHKAILPDEPLVFVELLQTELEKYQLIRRTVADWLESAASRAERDWQKLIVTFLLLIFPKYVAILQNVRIADSYSRRGTVGHRNLDIALVDAAGNLDVIEIKKPHDVQLLAKTHYRKNRVPSRELTGTIMQAEKYLFHLSKWGTAGERELNTRYARELPPGLEISITSPKAVLILGRDRQGDGASLLDPELRVDYEIIRRKYANMIDIMTYDDLLRRLDNIIASLEQRLGPRSDL
jgi:hypothetical protein